MVQRKIEHGVVIVATGAHEYQPAEDEYLYGQDDRVMTQLELAQRMERGEIGDPQNVVMIQCVGSPIPIAPGSVVRRRLKMRCT